MSKNEDTNNEPQEPLAIWLQWHGDGDPDAPGEVDEGEVTWSREQIFDADIEYVRAAEVRAALGGDPCSSIFGNGGLLAATMRCVEAISQIEDLVTTDQESKTDFIQRVRAILGGNVQSVAQSHDQ